MIKGTRSNLVSQVYHIQKKMRRSSFASERSRVRIPLELHTAQLFQLFLHAAHFQSKYENFLDLTFCVRFIRVQQLHIATHDFPNHNGIAQVQVLTKSEVAGNQHTGLYPLVGAAIAFAGAFGRLDQVVAVLFAENAALLPVLPEEAVPAVCRTGSMVADTVHRDGQNFFHR